MQTFPGYVHPKSYPETCTSFSHIFFQCLLFPSIRPIFETSNKNPHWTFIHHIPRTNEKCKEYLSKIIYSNSHISCQRYLKIIHTFLPILPSINIIYKPFYSNSSYSTTRSKLPHKLTDPSYRESFSFIVHPIALLSLQKETFGIPLIDSVAMHAPRPRCWHTVFAFGRNTTLMALTCSQRRYRAGNSRLSASHPIPPRLGSALLGRGVPLLDLTETDYLVRAERQ